MFYLIHLDHHGGYQGIYEAFSDLDMAKKYLDDRPEQFRRCGMIAVYANTGCFAKVIVEIPLTLEKDERGEYDVDEPLGGEDNEEEMWKRYDIWKNAVDKVLDIVESHVHFLSDWDL